jgi:hypothetical protein
MRKGPGGWMSFAFIEEDVRSAESHALILNAQGFLNAQILWSACDGI